MSIESKTKEQILLEHDPNVWANYDDDLDPIYNAMETYARSRAIEFAEWILKEHVLARDTNWFDAGKHFSSPELYELFSHQTEK